MIDLIKHPRFFDVLILALFAGASLRWLIEGNSTRSIYWAAAFVLNYAVSFGRME